MIFNGLRFGMLLQLAVGPLCLLVFNTSMRYGFLTGLQVILAIALIDAVYITLSCVGISAVINRAGVKTVIKLVGCCVLVLFGINIIMSAFDLVFLPGVTLFTNFAGCSLFIQGLLLTASNPLTIIFWGGVFSTRMIENKWNNKQLFFFAVGCVLSTLIFLSLVAVLGSIMSSFLPKAIMQVLNVIVGIVLIFLGARLLLKKEKAEQSRDLNLGRRL